MQILPVPLGTEYYIDFLFRRLVDVYKTEEKPEYHEKSNPDFTAVDFEDLDKD